MDPNCIFCKIVAGQIPSTKVYEDEKVLAFLDIAPVNVGHTLVIPKKHYANLEDVPEAELCEVMKVVKKVGLALKKGLGVTGYNISENNDPIAGQIVAHLHFHVIPRVQGDNLHLWPQRQFDVDQIQAAAEKLRKAF